MRAPEAEPEVWSPPTGLVSELLACGVWWDAVRVPEYLGGRMLAWLGDAGGAVIRDPYGHRYTWLTTAHVTASWHVPEDSCVQLLSTAARLDVPPHWRTRSATPHWARPWTQQYGLTSPDLLRAALDSAIATGIGSCEEADR